jgi:hypothetical protein
VKGIDLKPELEELIRNIGMRNMYSGNKISDSVMKLFEIESDDFHDGILVPFWLSVLERGRGPRRSNTDHGLVKKIYAWMERHNMFRSAMQEGKIREAKFITWYINKYGNKQFRNKTFVDIYTTERAKTIKQIEDKFSLEIGKITMEIL